MYRGEFFRILFNKNQVVKRDGKCKMCQLWINGIILQRIEVSTESKEDLLFTWPQIFHLSIMTDFVNQEIMWSYLCRMMKVLFLD